MSSYSFCYSNIVLLLSYSLILIVLVIPFVYIFTLLTLFNSLNLNQYTNNISILTNLILGLLIIASIIHSKFLNFFA